MTGELFANLVANYSDRGETSPVARIQLFLPQVDLDKEPSH